MTILLVDDDEDDVELFSEALKEVRQNIQILTRHNGLDALALLTTGTIEPNHVFLDINMPRMDGMTCLERIRASFGMRYSITMYSTTIIPSQRQRCAFLQADCMEKPSSYDALVTALRHKLEKLTS